MRNKILLCLTIGLFFLRSGFATVYYVSTTGNDTYGDGSASNPWRTIRYAATKVLPNAGHTIQLSAGIFMEAGQIQIPAGVNIEGSGKTSTIIKAASSFYHNPQTPDYAPGKFLISLKSPSQTNGNQSLRNFSIDGDLKQVHGGIYVRHRSHVVIDGVRIQDTNFNGIWLWDVEDSKITNTDLINCSWGSTAYCAGALHLGNIERVEIDQLHVNESVGYGIKAIGPADENSIIQLKIHDSRISVNPHGLWNNGEAPNIAIELFQDELIGCEIYNSYVDNTISVVTNDSGPPTGIQTVRIHHNTIDMETRSKGTGYGVELTVHDAEIDHNYFIKGSYGIANWTHPMQNWNIHHNVFYALEGVYPGDILRSQSSGLHNVNFYNNTIEFVGEKTMNVIGVYGGVSENLNIINNLFINNNSAYSYYPNSLLHTENSAVVNYLVVKNNFFHKLPPGTVPGTYSNNLEGDPKIYGTGDRPDPYYQPVPKSPLLNAGLHGSPGLPGMTDVIGAFEFDEGLFNEPPQISITSPLNESSSYAGSGIDISTEVTDSTGTVTGVQFFTGSTKIGEDFSSPFAFRTAELMEGSYSLTAIATDNYGAQDTSAAVNITVVPWIKLQLYAPDAELWGHMTFTTDSTATKGTYFSIPSGYGENYTLGASAARFDFELDTTDNYTLWVRAITPGPQNRAYYIYDGKGNWTTWVADVHSNWTWIKVTDFYKDTVATFPFTKGSNLLVFSWLHDNVPVDQIIVTNNQEFVPSTKTVDASGRVNTALPAVKGTETANPEITRGIFLYPNPVRRDFTITYESPVAQQAKVKLITMSSVIVKQVTVHLSPGANVIELDSDNLSDGIYFLSFITSTGETYEIKTAVVK